MSTNMQILTYALMITMLWVICIPLLWVRKDYWKKKYDKQCRVHMKNIAIYHEENNMLIKRIDKLKADWLDLYNKNSKPIVTTAKSDSPRNTVISAHPCYNQPRAKNGKYIKKVEC